jgi:hypothetical protein
MDGETHVSILFTGQVWLPLRNPWHWKEKSYLITDEIGALASFDFVLQPPEVEVVDPPLPEVAMEEEPAPEPEIGRNRFKPIPLGMRPEGPYNINPVGVTDKRVYLGNVRRQDGEESEAEQEIEVTRERGEDGRVMIGYQRSATLGLGSVWCWVDDDREGGRMIEGYWAMRQRNMGMWVGLLRHSCSRWDLYRVTEVTSGLSPGPHRLYCELVDHTLDPLGRTEFRIFAVMHD